MCNADTEKTPIKKKKYKLPKSKIKAKCYSFFNLKKSKKFIAFYSISFPKGLPDDLCFILLNTWLTRCRKLQGLNNYLWITERQKNGTLHYHLLTNDYMPIREVNRYMEKSLFNLAKKKDFPNSIKIPDKYNGVDVDNLYYSKRKKNRKKANTKEQAQRKLSFYLTKYVTKNTEKFTRLSWHSSRSISGLFTKINLTAEEVKELEAELLKNKKRIIVKKFDYFTLYILNFNLSEKFYKKLHDTNELVFSKITKPPPKKQDKLS